MNHAKKMLLHACMWGALLLPLPTVVLAQDADLLDGPEQDAMTDTLQNALEYNATNASSEWVNPDTGRAGNVVPMRTFDGPQGQPCREFVTTIIIGGREEQGYGTACRQPDGDWQIVADDLQSPSVPASGAPRAAREYPRPAQYYDYPAGFYGPYRIFLSFGFVHRSGHRHAGHYYLDGFEFGHRYPLVIRERLFVGPRVYKRYPWRHRRDHRGVRVRWDDGHRRHDGRRDRYDDHGGRRGGGRDWDDHDRGDRDRRYDRDRGDDHRRGRDDRRGGGGGHRGRDRD